MKRLSLPLTVFLLLASLAACSKSDDVQPKPVIQPEQKEMNETAASAQAAETVTTSRKAPVAEVAFDYASMQEDVLIQLDEEARIHSPITTLLAPRTYKYMMFFKQPMNQQSVEEALIKNVTETPSGRGKSAIASLEFQWASDLQLHLQVNVKQHDQVELYTQEYTLTVKGAQTAAGTRLENPPEFRAALQSPDQIWRLSVDGKTHEPLTSFKDPYMFENLDENGSYYLLNRSQRFCGCDAKYPRLYSIYDTTQKQIISYPVELSTHYLGAGRFTADRKGFFFAEPDAGLNVPVSDSAIKLQIDQFIYGANFSKDHNYLLMAVGNEGKQKDPQLLIHSLLTGSVQQIKGSANGSVPRDLESGNLAGVHFYDDGENVYLTLQDEKSHAEIRYVFSWRNKVLQQWNAPIPIDSWSSFTTSSDRVYQLYHNGGLYKRSIKISNELNLRPGVWIPGTHQIAKEESDDTQSSSSVRGMIRLYDADAKQFNTIASKLPVSTKVIGASQDGQWIYFTSMLSPHGSQ